MKNIRSKKKLTLDRETIRQLRVITTTQLARAQGGNEPIIGNGSGGACTESLC
jgi:hypothetical protein